MPGIPAIVTAIESPVVLQIQPLRIGWITADLVHALAELWMLVRQELCAHTFVAGVPRHPAIIGAITASRGDGDDHAVTIGGMGHDGVQTQPATARHPLGPMRMFQHSFDGAPTLAAVL